MMPRRATRLLSASAVLLFEVVLPRTKDRLAIPTIDSHLGLVRQLDWNQYLR